VIINTIQLWKFSFIFQVRQKLIVTQPLLEVLMGRSEMEEFVETKSERLRSWLPMVSIDTNIRIQ